MKKNRVFAILNWKKDRKDNVDNELLSKLPDGSKVFVFYKKSDYVETEPKYAKEVELVQMSDEEGHNRAAALNFVYLWMKEKFAGKDTIVHVIYDSIQIKKDTSAFLNAIEEMIDKLKLDVWFNTYTDGCNFVFTKFDGRVSISINEPELKAIYDKTIIWTSHSNPNWSILDPDKLEIKDGKVFDDRFEIPMFWIIKFLCERKKEKKGFMNYYPTIAEEIGVFKGGDFKGIEPSQEQMSKEDMMFRAMEIDHSPNMSVEELMDFIIDRLKS